MSLRQGTELFRKLLFTDDAGKAFPAGEAAGSAEQDILGC